MSSARLPKARLRHTDAQASSRTPSLHDLSHRGRVISGRRVASAAAGGGGARIVSRGDLFTRPGGHGGAAGELDFDEAIDFAGNKHTILSNFEEWIKLLTDNKITSKNSWQIALIDYFRDLNVIKDGENINFQRASATLDGCVKIYLSRVESVATETGKLLSGLAKKKEGDDVGTPSDDEDGEGGENATNVEAGDAASAEQRKKRKMNRVLESTLVDFDTIRVKKLDQELAIDPLFKKALAEFDEGGAKSLLLNTLHVDGDGRVVFEAGATGASEGEAPQQAFSCRESALDVLRLAPFVQDVGALTICPSLLELQIVLQDINRAKTVLGGVNNKFMDEERADGASGSALPYVFPDLDDDDGGADFGAEDDDPLSNFNESIVRLVLDNDDAAEGRYEVAERTILDRDLMAYFDNTMKLNWRGPEHWKVANVRLQRGNGASEPRKGGGGAGTGSKKKTVINFMEDDGESDETLFEPPKNAASTTLRPEQRISVLLNKLPEDIRYTLQRLTNLFLKQHKTVMHFERKRSEGGSEELTDEHFFAEQYVKREKEHSHAEEDNPFYDDVGGEEDYGGIDFNDALSATADADEAKKEASGLQLLAGGRKARPEYVNFSRIAKRVDVKLLKDNLWRAIKTDPTEEAAAKARDKEAEEKDFEHVITSIGQMYPTEEKKDLSTSFCFICLLHLANEHGLSITLNEAHDNLVIKGF